MDAKFYFPDLLSPILFAGGWFTICWLISLSGWHELAKWYRANSGQKSATDVTFWFQSGGFGRKGKSFGNAEYRGVLWARCSDKGLRLSVSLPFRFGHPPLLIPWAALGPVITESVFFGLARNNRVLIAMPDGSQDIELSITGQELADSIEQHQQIANLGPEDYVTR